MNKLQRIQNSLARVISGATAFSHINPVLRSLHWLPVEQRVLFKLGVLTYKVLHHHLPSYLFSCLSSINYSHHTRSSYDATLLKIPFANSILGSRAFSIFAPTFWNSLPLDLRRSSSL